MATYHLETGVFYDEELYSWAELMQVEGERLKIKDKRFELTKVLDRTGNKQEGYWLNSNGVLQPLPTFLRPSVVLVAGEELVFGKLRGLVGGKDVQATPRNADAEGKLAQGDGLVTYDLHIRGKNGLGPLLLDESYLISRDEFSVSIDIQRRA
ncbi:MAG: hypothetical protein WCT01_04540 [Candidatus Shapirobacteria bacterium]|jgi:hypothetical protein